MSDVALLLTQLDQAYDRRSWHGTNLRGSIRGITPNQAVWRPAPRRHNVQELIVHCAYWKYVVARRLTGEKRGSFSLKGSNWFRRDVADAAVLRDDVRVLEECHRHLRASVAALTSRALHKSAADGRPAHWLVSGAIAHDLYHAGQIQLLKRMRT
jgi:DinB superfamily